MRPPPLVARASDLLLSAFVRPPVRSAFAAWAIPVGLVALLGLWDFASGTSVSLALFYLVPITLTTGWLGPGAGVVISLLVTVVRLMCDWLSQPSHVLPVHIVWNVCAALIIFLFVVWLLTSFLRLQQQLAGKLAAQSDELRESTADRQRLEMEILDISARERSAFGRELHDELGQHLFATALAAQTLAERLGGREGATEAKAIVGWIEDGIAKTRKLARGLLLARIEPDRFAQELDELAIGATRGGIECRMAHQGGPVREDASQCAQLFRIAQEAVANATRHAQPRRIQISLSCDAAALSLTVEDDGVGLPQSRRPGGGMGLRIMEHRARLIGASLAFESQPGAGTRMVCRLPRAGAEA